MRQGAAERRRARKKREWETGSEPETEAGAQAESEPEAESENEKESISQARIDRQIFISFNGEIQGFKADSSGLLQNIEQLAYLAPRGGLGMEMEAEKVPESKNPYLAESAGLTDMEEILTSESGLVWVRLFCGSSADLGRVRACRSTGILPHMYRKRTCISRKKPGEKDLWNIWKLPGYGEWLEQEIRIFLRVMTGMDYGGV